MADDRWPTWAAEQAGTSSGPTVGQVLVGLALVAALLVGLLSASTTATAEGGRPSGSPACAEMRRLERHGVADGSSYWRVAAACADSSGP
jgi:hypothetical protein